MRNAVTHLQRRKRELDFVDIDENIIWDTEPKSGADYEDITSKVRSIQYDNETRSFLVEYGNSNKQYHYNIDRLYWYRFDETLDFEGLDIVRAEDNRVLRDIEHVAVYSDFFGEDDYLLRIVFTDGHREDYLEQDLSFENKATYFEAFRYLRDVCEATKSDDSDPNIREYCVRQYNRISNMQLSQLALGCYLDSGEYPVLQHPVEHLLIYPFGLNLSQIAAVDNAMRNKISIVEGPPGTGKTQTILNMIANLIVAGKSVLMVSPNNPATDNVIEKLEEAGYGFLVARLGRKENRNSFFQEGQSNDYPEFILEPSLAVADRELLEIRLSDTLVRLQSLLSSQEEYHELISQLDDDRLQNLYFEQEHPDIVAPTISQRTTLEQILLAYVDIKKSNCAGKAKSLTLPFEQRLPLHKRLIFRFIYGIENWSYYKKATGDIEAAFFKLILEQRIKNAKSIIASFEDDLLPEEAKALADKSTNISKQLFTDTLRRRYQIYEKRQTFANIWEADAQKFRYEYPVVTSTVDAAFNQTGQKRLPFDYVIIDESSQATTVKGALALASAKNAVIVGDTKQLPPVIDSKSASCINAIEAGYSGLVDSYSCAKHSLLSSLSSLADCGSLKAPRQLLRQHYRCNPYIIGFCNKKYYDGQLIIMTQSTVPASDVLRAVYSGEYDREGDFNRRQADDFENELRELNDRYPYESIGIVAPYKNQVKGMRQDIRFNGIDIDTIHKFQGREKDVLALITQRNKITSFLDNPNLINVAVSRAKEKLFVFVSKTLLGKNGSQTNNIAELVRYIGYQGGEVKPSVVSSIYDALSDNKLLQPIINRSPYNTQQAVPSETLTAEALNRTIENMDLKNTVSFLQNYLLKLLFAGDSSTYTEREKEYIKQGAHVDIVVYYRMDKRPLFGIEIQGSHHWKSSVQRERDEVKRELFRKVGLPLLELPTHGSGEINKLEHCIRDAINGQMSDSAEVVHEPQPTIIPSDEDDSWTEFYSVK